MHIAVVDAPRKALDDFFGNVELPDHAEVLGPVDLPPGIDVPGEWDRGEYGPAQRMLVRSPLHGRAALGSALRTGLINRAARRQTLPLRVQVNPIDVG